LRKTSIGYKYVVKGELTSILSIHWRYPMRMTKLKLEDLAVESFATGRVPNAGGTVRAHQDAFTEAAVDGMDFLDASDYPTCRWTCDDATCGIACPTGVADKACNPPSNP
jgi:hypothetical protein